MSKSKGQKNQGKQYDPRTNLKKYIKDLGRKLELYETLMDNELDVNGLGFVIVSRRRQNGDVITAVFLIDKYCLGIKDVFYDILEEEEYRAKLEAMEETYDIKLMPIEKNYCFNLIYGALEYAEDLGIEPHKDFDTAEFMLPDIDDIEYMDIEFGKDGLPTFISGPFDNERKILATLERAIGAGNFMFISNGRDGDFDYFNDEEE